MKKLSYLLSLLMIGGLIFSSCSKDDDDDKPVVKTPTMNFKGGTHQASGTEYVSGNQTFTSGDIFWVGITASENSNSKSKLTNLKITREYEDVITITVLDSTFSSSVFSADLGMQAYPQAGKELWTFVITDKAGEKAQLSFTITTEAAAATIATYGETVLGSYDVNAPNSSFASVNGTTYSMSDAANNSDKIDWIYFDGVTKGNTLIAPNDDLVVDVFGSVANWTTRNATKFKTTSLTTSQFDAIESATEIANIAQGADLSRLCENEASGMAVDKVYGFITAGQKMGLIKITNIQPGANNGLSEISFVVKVEL